MQIVHYPHSTLRHSSLPIVRVDARLREMVSTMFELMYEAKGIGLAANQVDLPLRLFVVNLEAEPGKGEELVFLNPVLSHPKGLAEREEGCLSLPGLYGEVKRPERIHLSAYDLQGKPIEAELSGMMARVVQHEIDHLDGVLFTDRLSETGKLAAREALEDFERRFAENRRVGAVPEEAALAARRAEWEARYCR